ncbi:MAG: hypothetical protein ABH850_03510 [Candidatus Micrarchaeota archaeon]
MKKEMMITIILIVFIMGCTQGPEGQAIKPVTKTVTKTITDTEAAELLKDATEIREVGELKIIETTEDGITKITKTQEFAYNTGSDGDPNLDAVTHTMTISCTGSCSTCSPSGCSPIIWSGGTTGCTGCNCLNGNYECQESCNCTKKTSVTPDR